MSTDTDLAALEGEIRSATGVRLFTVLAWLPERRVLHRLYSNRPEAYPVGGEKSVEVAAGWLEQCIERQQPYLGADKDAVREIFADHATIEALGCGAVINAPVTESGRTLGILNVLDGEGSYDRTSLQRVAALAHRAVPPLRAFAHSADRPGI
jgi:hypothetical protein